MKLSSCFVISNAFFAALCVSTEAYSWSLFEREGVCALVSEAEKVIKNGEIDYQIGFRFEYSAVVADSRSPGSREHTVQSDEIHLLVPGYSEVDFEDGARVDFMVKDEYYTGQVKYRMQGLAKKYSYALSGNQVALLIGQVSGAKRPLFEAQNGNPMSEQEMQAAENLNRNLNIKMQAITRNGKLVTAETRADWIGSSLPGFYACIEKLKKTDASNAEGHRAGPALENWFSVPLFGSHIRLPGFCEKTNESRSPGEIIYFCNRHGENRNIVGSVIGVGPIHKLSQVHIERMKEPGTEHEIICGMDVYSFANGRAVRRVVLAKGDFMVLDSVAIEVIPELLGSSCNAR